MKVACERPIPALANTPIGALNDSARIMGAKPLPRPVQTRSCPFNFSLRTACQQEYSDEGACSETHHQVIPGSIRRLRQGFPWRTRA